MKHFSRVDILFLILVGVAYYLLLRLYVGPVEDIIYQYVSGENGLQYDKPVATFGDAILSQIQDYQTSNGRFLNHVVIQYLCSIPVGREIYFVLTTVAFMGLLAGILVLIRNNCKTNRADKYIVLLLLMYLSPHQGLTIFGHVAFGVNYMWTSCVTIWFLILWRYIRNHTLSIYGKTVCALMALVAGALHEGFSLPVSAYLFLFYCFNRRSFKGFEALLVLSYWIGTCTVVFAPANILRLQTVESYASNAQYSKLSNALRILKNLLLGHLAVKCFTMVTILYVFCSRKAKERIMQNLPFIVVPVFVILFAMFVAYVDVHQMMPMVPFTVILTVLLLYSVLNRVISRLEWGVIACSVMVIIPSFINIYKCRRELVDSWDKFLQSAKLEHVDYANGEPIMTYGQRMSSYFVKYTDLVYCSMHVTGNHFMENIISAVTANGDTAKIKCTLPDTKENIIAKCRPENLLQEYFYQGGDRWMIVKTPNRETVEKIKIEYYIEPSVLSKIIGLGRQKKVYMVDTDCHSFLYDGELYSIVYQSPDILNRH